MTAKLSVREKFSKALEIFKPAEIDRIELVVVNAMNAIDEAKRCVPDIDVASYKDAVLEAALHSAQMTRIALKDAHRSDVPPALANALINMIAVAQTALLKRHELWRPEVTGGAKGDASPCFEPVG